MKPTFATNGLISYLLQYTESLKSKVGTQQNL